MNEKRVVVTRSLSQSRTFCERLSGLGATPIVIPAIRIVPMQDEVTLEAALADLPHCDWALFTSVNGVDMFFAYLDKRGRTASVFDGVKVAAVGTATAAALRDRRTEPDFVPERFVGEEIARGLDDVAGKTICLLRAAVAGEELPRLLQSRGAVVNDVAVYRNVPAEIRRESLAELERGVDIVTLTSGSTARNFAEALRNVPELEPMLARLRFACIGPVTADTARGLKLDVAVVAEVHTTDGLIDALISYFDKEKI